MALNFPNAPTTNQLYPQPPIAGVPVYRWDGQKWTSSAAKTPVYTDGSTAMTAQLTLIAPPVNPTDASAKSYVDGAVRWDSAQTLTASQQVQGRANINTFSLRTRTVLTSGSGTYTTKANCVALNVRMVGGGGGGGGSSSGTTGGTGGNGVATTFGPLTAGGGYGNGNASTGAAGGGAGGGDINLVGGNGGGSTQAGNSQGGNGGYSLFGSGVGVTAVGNPGQTANPGGGGGSGGGSGGSGWSGGGGGAGGYCEKLFVPPAASYAYAVGTGGGGGAAGTSGFVGGAGGAGLIIIDEYY
jgi:hypothetical protein